MNKKEREQLEEIREALEGFQGVLQDIQSSLEEKADNLPENFAEKAENLRCEASACEETNEHIGDALASLSDGLEL